MATYGSFPGVQVQTVSGGITGVQIGEEEKLVLFGEAGYDDTTNPADGDEDAVSGTATSSSAEQINARREANDKFTDGSELAEGMKEALANGANIEYLYGVAVPRLNAVGESQAAQTGTLDHFPVYEDEATVVFDDGGTVLDVEFRYNGAPVTPGTTDTVYVNPLTGEYAADAAPGTSFAVDYKHLDYSGAFSATNVRNVVREDETGVYVALSDSDTVSASLQSEVSTLRSNYQLVTALSVAEPNANSAETPPAPRYDTANYGNANQSITSEFYYKFAPGRKEDENATVMGGVGGLFAGNAINDPIYNEALNGYSALEQKFSKSDADNMRAEDVIPIRDTGSLRVKGNRSTAYGSADSVAADFFSRRITDRVILIGKQVGDNIIGRINDSDTRSRAEEEIESQLLSLVQDRLIQPNTNSETSWAVEVYEDSNNDDQVNIDITFTPYGIVKQVDETITINTR